MSTISECKYWVISFSLDDAHIVEAHNSVDIVNNPIKTLRMQYSDLRYKYINIDEEARKLTLRRKSQIDPRILFDSNITIDDLLALPQMEGRKDEREHLAKTLELIKMAPQDIRDRKVREYDEIQIISQEGLYAQIKTELEQKKDYAPKQIQHLTFGEINFGLSQAGYEIGQKGFVTLDQALDELYHVWEEMRNNFNDKVGLMNKKEDIYFFKEKLIGIN